MSRTHVSTLLLLGLLTACPAAGAALLPAKADSVASLVLEQNRAIEVYLPEESAKDPKQRFETLYVLDGDWNAKIVIDVVAFMRQLGMLPPVIIVSVPNYFDAKGVNSRDHDLTPSALPNEPRSGGAAMFLKFLRTELLPYVDQHYPTNGVHLIHGHSYGGLFLMYVLANDAQLFDGYLALDPAMRWDNQTVNAALGASLGRVPPSGKAIYIAGRSGAGSKEMALDGLEAAFRDHASPSLHWTLTLYDDETHDSLKLKATYDGLKYLFDGYTQDPVEIAPSDGIVVKGQPIRLLVTARRVHLHYTTDGSAPTATSPGDSDGAITIDNPDKLRLAVLSNRGVFDRVVPMQLRAGVPLTPRATGRGDEADSNWRYSVYSASAWPHLGTTKPTFQGSATDEVSLGRFGESALAVSVHRRLRVLEDGYYVFAVDSDRARLGLDGATLISNNGELGHRTITYLAPLHRGVYSLSVDLLRANAGSQVHVVVIQCNEHEPNWWTPKPWLELNGK
jgi:predicted alpha/beta superfamily hydrolase